MKEETGKVAKSDAAFAPGRCDTTCSATSPCRENGEETMRFSTAGNRWRGEESRNLEFVQSVAEVLEASRLLQELHAGADWMNTTTLLENTRDESV